MELLKMFLNALGRYLIALAELRSKKYGDRIPRY